MGHDAAARPAAGGAHHVDPGRRGVQCAHHRLLRRLVARDRGAQPQEGVGGQGRYGELQRRRAAERKARAGGKMMGAPGMLEMAAGVLLTLVVLADVFMIVLYARTNTGVFSRLVAHNLWRAFVAVGKRLGPEESKVLEFSGPIILLAVLGAWGTLLCVGVALIIQPNLGTGIKAMQGQTPQDFITALYVAGTSLAFVGAADFAPQSAPFQILFLVT